MNSIRNSNASSERPPLVIIAGPTAAGKSRIAVELALRISGEIISADSMQVYRGMDIGSAKITESEMKGVRHHLIDVLSPREPFNIFLFRQMAQEAAQGILERGHIPIVAGGTGFYIQSLLYGVAFSDEPEDRSYRKELEEKAARGMGQALYRELEAVDPASAAAIHPHNLKRVIRALEYSHFTGEPISVHNERERGRESEWNGAYFVLTRDRKKIYEQIDRRVDQMLAAGLREEVEELMRRGMTRDMVSMQGLGYKEMIDFLQGASTLEEAVYKIKRDTRHFAKRQLTWFGREKDVLWVDQDLFSSDEEVISHMLGVLVQRKIIDAERINAHDTNRSDV